MSSHGKPPYGWFNTFTFTSFDTTPCWFVRFSCVIASPVMRSASAHSIVSSLCVGTISK